MRLEDYDYDLPPDLVAQVPAAERDGARLLVHETERDRTLHASVRELADFLERGDLLVFNDTRVRPARLFGRRETGGRVELLFLEPDADDPRTWRALVHPARRLKAGERVALDEERAVTMLERCLTDDGRPDAAWRVRLEGRADEGADAWMERLGRMPLPPYIERPRGEPDPHDALDRERYQTVYAREPGAVAAPTAGLHFTPELFERLDAKGVRRVHVTLHVGEGTFRPVAVDRVEDHRMHAERFRLGPEAARAVDETRERGGRVVAVGTTSARVLESLAEEGGRVRPGEGETRLFLRPGSPIRVVDRLFTNFHLPKSTLLMLVSAFAGRERVLELYAEAVERRYRFFSYGDAMLLDRLRAAE